MRRAVFINEKGHFHINPHRAESFKIFVIFSIFRFES